MVGASIAKNAIQFNKVEWRFSVILFLHIHSIIV